MVVSWIFQVDRVTLRVRLNRISLICQVIPQPRIPPLRLRFLCYETTKPSMFLLLDSVKIKTAHY